METKREGERRESMCRRVSMCMHPLPKPGLEHFNTINKELVTCANCMNKDSSQSNSMF